MENPRESAIARLKEANNVLVTVSTNPTVDQLAGAIGIALLLNKLGKHASAVFSGNIPSTIEFLKPEETLETNTDSLRDFIIALDKSKADKLRYKVEDKQVRIFITPYRTSIDQKDLEFTHGDFNVDAVIALGVHEQRDLDSAIVSHGRILHDATIISVNNKPNGGLGGINWVNERASSLCEMLTDIGTTLKSDAFDPQMATALLTGIVAETNRFSNQKTTPDTMSLSAKLMAAGANQQLVATKLQDNGVATGSPAPQSQPASSANNSATSSNADSVVDDDGTLSIQHGEEGNSKNQSEKSTDKNSVPSDGSQEDSKNQTVKSGALPQQNNSKPVTKTQNDKSSHLLPDSPSIIMDPPSMGGTLTASGLPEDQDEDRDPLTLPPVDTPILTHNSGPAIKSGDNLSDTGLAVDKTSEDQAGPQVSQNVDSAQPQPNSPSDSSKAQSLPDSKSGDSPDKGNNAASLSDILSSTSTDDSAANQDNSEDTLPDNPSSSKEPSPKEDMQTLSDLEKSVDSPHTHAGSKEGVGSSNQSQSAASTQDPNDSAQDLESARKAVSEAVDNSSGNGLEPVETLGAQPVNLDLGHGQNQDNPNQTGSDNLKSSEGDGYLDISKIDETTGLPSENQTVGQSGGVNSANPASQNLSPPPPGPPPMMPPPQTQSRDPQVSFGEQRLPNAEDDSQAQDPIAPI